MRLVFITFPINDDKIYNIIDKWVNINDYNYKIEFGSIARKYYLIAKYGFKCGFHFRTDRDFMTNIVQEIHATLDIPVLAVNMCSNCPFGELIIAGERSTIQYQIAVDSFCNPIIHVNDDLEVNMKEILCLKEIPKAIQEVYSVYKSIERGTYNG